MTRKTRSAKNQHNQEPSVVPEQPVAIEEPPKPKTLTRVQKVKMMNALADAVENSDLESKIKSLNNGSMIWDVFCDAVEVKIGEIMDGDTDNTMAANQLEQASQNLGRTMQQLDQYARAISTGPLAQAIFSIASKMDAQMQPQQPVMQQQTQQAQVIDQSAPNSPNMPTRVRGGETGTF